MNLTVKRVWMDQRGITDLATANVLQDAGRRAAKMYEIAVADIVRHRAAVRLPSTLLRVYRSYRVIELQQTSTRPATVPESLSPGTSTRAIGSMI